MPLHSRGKFSIAGSLQQAQTPQTSLCKSLHTLISVAEADGQIRRARLSPYRGFSIQNIRPVVAMWRPVSTLMMKKFYVCPGGDRKIVA
jgi:hypothetical protein